MILCACVRGTVFMRIMFGLVGSICLGMFKVGIFFFFTNMEYSKFWVYE